MEFLGQNTGVGSLSLLQGNLPNPGIQPRSSALQTDSLPAEPQGKCKNTSVGSLSLLQRIFPTQELNRGLLRCRRILYPLSCQGSSICLIHSIHSVHMSIAVSRPSHHSLAPSVSMHLSSTSVRLHLFCSQIICSIFIDSTYTH